ncbi:MAG: type II toxin-antitoxin system HicB family antitoxin [Lachnospiraceae bacterium]|nr:type II toxin-antitoxin system HicB family antitoxin [Lachnospiraceae bacterium]
MKKRVNITLEDEVIQRIDHFADEHYTSRSGAITMLIVEATDGSPGGHSYGWSREKNKG